MWVENDEISLLNDFRKSRAKRLFPDVESVPLLNALIMNILGDCFCCEKTPHGGDAAEGRRPPRPVLFPSR